MAVSDKTNTFKFTIQLNAQDKLHQAAAAYLNQKGRRKGQYVVNAILQYEQSEPCSIPPSASLDMETIEAIVRRVLKEQHSKTAAPAQKPTIEPALEVTTSTPILAQSNESNTPTLMLAAQHSEESLDADDIDIDPAGMDAIMEALHAFRQK